MNKGLKKVNIEKVLFFDAELVRLSEKLELDTREFFNYQKKTRNRETDEFLSNEEVVEHYRKKAALKMSFNKVVTIGVGYVVKGNLRIKAITGTEHEVIQKFLDITCAGFQYLCGFNIIGFDIPMILANGAKYFDVTEHIPDQFNTSGKKPWELKAVIDLMDQFKGTHFYNPSLDDACFHFNIPSPKGDIDGSMVSETYYTEGVDRIATYVKQDVLAAVRLFQAMRHEEFFTDFVDVNEEDKLRAELSEGSSEEEVEEYMEELSELSPLERLYIHNDLSPKVKAEIESLVTRKMTKKDKENLFIILRGVYVRTDFVNKDQDSKSVVETKEAEIREFIDNLEKS
jgi:3'-5' exonuclease